MSSGELVHGGSLASLFKASTDRGRITGNPDIWAWDGEKATADPSTHHPQTLPQERRLGPRSLGMTAQQGEGLCGNDRSSEMIDLGWGKATADAIRLASLGSSCSGRALRLTAPKLCPKEHLRSLGTAERRSGLRSLRMTAQRCEVAVRVAAKSRRDWSVWRAAPDSIA